MNVYRSFDDGLGTAGGLGELNTRGVVTALARRMSLAEDEIQARLLRTELFAFYLFTDSFFRRHVLPEAIVTVNAAHFSEVARWVGLSTSPGM